MPRIEELYPEFQKVLPQGWSLEEDEDFVVLRDPKGKMAGRFHATTVTPTGIKEAVEKHERGLG